MMNEKTTFTTGAPTRTRSPLEQMRSEIDMLKSGQRRQDDDFIKLANIISRVIDTVARLNRKVNDVASE